MANGWTPDRKAKQARAIRQWKPWEKSTGPNSSQGKAKVASNATRHGLRSKRAREELSTLRKLLDNAVK